MKKLFPRMHQHEAIQSAVGFFTTNKRGQLIMPCGTGKTLATLWIAEAMQKPSYKILYQVPSLSLISQTLKEWKNNTSFPDFNYMCLCSDKTVDYDKDDISYDELLNDEITVTTDYDEISQFLKSKKDVQILFATYQSCEALTKAVKLSKTIFDIGFFDEAHKTANSTITTWNMALDDFYVPINKRIYMTATPKVYAPHIITKANDREMPLFSMDDETIYGKPFYELSFSEAIKQDIICDYEIIVIGVTNSEVKRIISSNKNIDIEIAAKQIALSKAIETYNINKIFTFHNSIAAAQRFIKTTKKNNIFHNVNTFHVNGKINAQTRLNIMDQFDKSEIAIMSNSRCLIEGVDAPHVDCVAFIDSKKSFIEIVQATGRALRKYKDKSKGYIFIPLILGDKISIEQTIDNSLYKPIFEVIQAMYEQDDVLQQVMNNLRQIQGRSMQEIGKYLAEWRLLEDKIKIIGIPLHLQEQFHNHIYLKSIEVTAHIWEFWYGLTLKYASLNNGNPNAPMRTIIDGYKLGHWQQNTRYSYSVGRLSKELKNKLDAAGFNFTKQKDPFEIGLENTKQYAILHDGNPNAPRRCIFNKHNLGAWQTRIRKRYKEKSLTQIQIQQLTDINFVWSLKDLSKLNSFYKGIKHSLAYAKENNSNPCVANRYVCNDGYELGSWQRNIKKAYKAGKLTKQEIATLNVTGFEWAIITTKPQGDTP